MEMILSQEQQAAVDRLTSVLPKDINILDVFDQYQHRKRIDRRHNDSKISDDQRQKIRNMIAINPEQCFSDIAKEVGVSPRTVRLIIYDEFPDELEKYRQKRQARLVEKIWDTEEKALEAMEAKDMNQEKLRDLAYSVDVLEEKRTLLLGGPTSIVENITDESIIVACLEAGIDIPPEIKSRLGQISSSNARQSDSEEVQGSEQA